MSEWRYDCPCDFLHPQSRIALPGRYHEKTCPKYVSPEVEAYLINLEQYKALADEVAESFRKVKRDFMETHSYVLTPFSERWLKDYDALKAKEVGRG